MKMTLKLRLRGHFRVAGIIPQAVLVYSASFAKGLVGMVLICWTGQAAAVEALVLVYKYWEILGFANGKQMGPHQEIGGGDSNYYDS
jgi:hypothetical protein